MRPMTAAQVACYDRMTGGGPGEATRHPAVIQSLLIHRCLTGRCPHGETLCPYARALAVELGLLRPPD